MIRQFLLNSFAEGGFEGNPAAVCIVDSWPSEAQMQQIAKDNNLSETAFCLCTEEDSQEPRFHIRWFTPGCEVDLCGHATLATSFVLFRHFFKEASALHFSSRSGDLHVTRKGSGDDLIVVMDFPAYGLEKVTEPSESEAALQAIACRGCGLERNNVKEIWKGIDYVAVLEDAQDVIRFKPDFEKIKALPGSYNLLVTAKASKGCENGTLNIGKQTDFVSRCFFPKEAIDEDPVTGSAHCTLGPLWAKKLGKTELTAYQASDRGGILHLTASEERVLIGGMVKEMKEM